MALILEISAESCGSIGTWAYPASAPSSARPSSLTGYLSASRDRATLFFQQASRGPTQTHTELRRKASVFPPARNRPGAQPAQPAFLRTTPALRRRSIDRFARAGEVYRRGDTRRQRCPDSSLRCTPW